MDYLLQKLIVKLKNCLQKLIKIQKMNKINLFFNLKNMEFIYQKLLMNKQSYKIIKYKLNNYN